MAKLGPWHLGLRLTGRAFPSIFASNLPHWFLKPLSYKVGVDPTHSALKTRSKKQESLKYHHPEPLLPEECLPTPAATATSATTALRGRQSPGLSAAEASGLR